MTELADIGPAAELAELFAQPRREPAPEPGIYLDIPMAQYLAWNAVSAGVLRQVRRSPAHARAFIDQPPPEPKTDDASPTVIGSALHTALIEPGLFPASYVRGPGGNWSHKIPRDIKAALQARFPDAVILKPDKFDAIIEARDSLQHHPAIERLLEVATGREVSIVWDDQDTGVRCKARPDLVLGGLNTIADLKSTIDASHEGFAREIAKWGYDLKAAFYLDGANAVMGKFSSFVFIAAEVVPPFACSVFELEPFDIATARLHNRKMLRIWAECTANKDWPAYDPAITYIATPEWRRAQLESVA